MSLGTEEGAVLVNIAREAALARLRHTPPPDLGEVAPALRVPAGAFVSLDVGGDLRGCIGYVEALWPLVETVARAGGAAIQDRRFPRVQSDEWPHLGVEVSVLSRLAPILPERVEVGTHGLLIRCSGSSGLLLPQVPVEHQWDRDTFLDHLCIKAGLPEGRWRQPGAELFSFTCQRFGGVSER